MPRRWLGCLRLVNFVSSSSLSSHCQEKGREGKGREAKGKEKEIEIDGAILIGLVNGASGVGRLILGYIADRLGRMNLFCVCMFVGSVSTFLWPLCQTYLSFGLYCFFFGFFCGGFVSLTPVVIADYWGTERFSGIIGLFYTRFVPRFSELSFLFAF